MTAPPDPPRVNGLMMVAAFREARLSGRQALRERLRESVMVIRRARAETAATATTATGAAAGVAATKTAESGSVFAGLVGLAAAERRAEAAQASAAPEPAAMAPDAVPADAEAAPPDASDGATAEPTSAGEAAAHASEADTSPATPPAFDPPLAAIGFGPSMLIRLGQLGLRSTGDLACADAAQLRAALGDISRLVDVETWISDARQTISARSGGASS